MIGQSATANTQLVEFKLCCFDLLWISCRFLVQPGKSTTTGNWWFLSVDSGQQLLVVFQFQTLFTSVDKLQQYNDYHTLLHNVMWYHAVPASITAIRHWQLVCQSAVIFRLCSVSRPRQHSIYGSRFLQVKRPTQQYQSTEGESCKGNNPKTERKHKLHMHTHIK